MSRRNGVLLVLAVFFFAAMLVGTFFGRRLGDSFRPHIAVSHPEYREVEKKVTIQLEGEEMEVIAHEQRCVIPQGAYFEENGGWYIYLLQKKEETFGEYYCLLKKSVGLEIQGETAIVQSGVSSSDYIALEIPDGMEEGERIVPVFGTRP